MFSGVARYCCDSSANQWKNHRIAKKGDVTDRTITNGGCFWLCRNPDAPHRAGRGGKHSEGLEICRKARPLSK